MDWKQTFESGLSYQRFLEQYGGGGHAERWNAVYEQVTLTSSAKNLLAGFQRRMNVLCLTGAWCGDCVSQCPIFQRFAEASEAIDLRFIDRDQDSALKQQLAVNGGNRVPVVVFLSEDYYECARYGDRTLSRYRELAGSLLGAACPTGIGDHDSIFAAVIDEWLVEFERIQLMLRLSGRLRQMHGD